MCVYVGRWQNATVKTVINAQIICKKKAELPHIENGNGIGWYISSITHIMLVSHLYDFTLLPENLIIQFLHMTLGVNQHTHTHTNASLWIFHCDRES